MDEQFQRRLQYFDRWFNPGWGALFQFIQRERRGETFMAFVNSINSNLEDDAPRLIWADWLDEYGFEQWAAFFRNNRDSRFLLPWITNRMEYSWRKLSEIFNMIERKEQKE